MKHQQQLKKLPSLLQVYRKILFSRKPGWDGKLMPNISVSLPQWKGDSVKVERYSRVCQFDHNAQYLPVTYLYTQVFRLHAIIFTNPAITIPLWGMIHLRNEIEQYRDIGFDETLRLECHLTESQVTDNGLEFELLSQAYAGQDLVWQAKSIYLYKSAQAKAKRVRPPRASGMTWDPIGQWPLQASLGREYASASGDYNLIHIHPILAKQFGFDKILAHGMWSKGRCVAALPEQYRSGACKISVEFKLPLFLPAEVSFGFEPNNDGCHFELRDGRGRRPHLVGQVERLN
ncbi:MaoC/PaaZ C-terminal domain-containing protein [Paraferrimonas haliotis]|uniref:Dehydratase n=1 Tax=Paraferrimonas haliotis TaxID=2013866 RepID=A0AA37TKZ3_9GAMM|nr:MaoC/PaaZ C-terminal domain-containing protein [Paraferrimonas haliotis]GLS82408.1 dehydratase [Paraferrimonas haliotis]